MRSPKIRESWKLEEAFADKGYHAICGVDEAGAGPLAGRVYAAAVMLPFGLELPHLNDSKKVTEKRREVLFDLICEKSICWSIAWASEGEVDEINILNARMLSMERAICGLSPEVDFALIDGNRNTGITLANAMVVKGDEQSASIAAASILAKVSRDRYMLEMAKEYPRYAFEQHKGYPTKLHYELLREHGPSVIHRKTFLKKI